MATRSKRFISGLLTGYGSIAANVVFTMASVPLALHYLEKEQFGLWALALQINGYLALIDLGMSSAVSRFIADHKDDVNGGDYGSHLLTGGIVFLIQGLVVAILGISFSWFAPEVFAIPAHLSHEFRWLLVVLTCTSSTSIILRSVGAPLWAFQRFDVINACGTAGLILTLVILWLGFHAGWGVMSFAIAQVVVLLGTLAVHAWICFKNGYFPSRPHWGSPSMAIFWEIFHFGKDILMVSIGAQLINATQIMIVSRWINLEAAATFSVATKFYTMAMQLVNNPISASAPGLTELHVRGEKDRFVRRYWDLITFTLAISVIAATGLAGGNRSMVTIWTGGSIEWSWTCDLLLGLLIVLRNFNGCFVGMFGLIKNWKPVRHIYLAEGLVFVPVAILFAKLFGITGILTGSLLVHLGVTTTMSARQALKVLGPWVGAAKTLGTALALIGLSSLFAWTACRMTLNPYVALGGTMLIGVIASVAIWLIILPENMKSEVANRIKGAGAGIARKLSRTA